MATVEQAPSTQVRKSVCPRDCPDTCSMLAQVEGGKVVRVVGDPDHPITRGYLCGRFQHYEELIHHKDRLLFPLAREDKSKPFERVSWDEALDRIVREFRAIIDEHGPEAILPYRYLGNMGVISTHYADRLWNKIGTARVGEEICAIAGVEAVLRVFGRLRGTEPHHLSKTKCVLAWGKNPKETNVHGWANALKDLHPLIVIDPFESDTARAADIHLQLQPATDSMLAIGMLKLLIEGGFVDERFLAERTLGFDALRRKVESVSLREVERVTGVPEGDIAEVIRLYGENRPSLILVGMGLQRNLNGGEIVANICMLPAITGQVGVPGGGIYYANNEWEFDRIHYPKLRAGAARRYNMIKLGRWLTATDEIKALYVYNSNPAVTCPNQTLVRRGMARDDLFVVVHDLFLTDSAKLANVVLPATTFAEHTDLHFSYWHQYVQINSPVIEPVGEARSNYWVFSELAHRMGYTEPCFSQSEEEVIVEALEGTRLDLEGLKRGPVFHGDPARTSFDDARFATPSGKIELIEPTHTAYGDDLHPYRLLSPKTKHLHSSQAFNLPSVARRLKRPHVFIHPEDAAFEGVSEGDLVTLWNDRGEVELEAVVSGRTLPKLLVSYNGWWGESNVNATTPDAEADLGGQSTFQSNWVSLELAQATTQPRSRGET